MEPISNCILKVNEKMVSDFVISAGRTSLGLPNSQTGRILESNSVLSSILLPLIRITWNFSYVKPLRFPPFNFESARVNSCAHSAYLYLNPRFTKKKKTWILSAVRGNLPQNGERGRKIKYIPVKPKRAPIWLSVKLKINAIFFFLPHPTRHGRYSCRGWEDSSRGRCKQGNWNSVTRHPLTILPRHLLMVAACAVDATAPADSPKPSRAAGVR